MSWFQKLLPPKMKRREGDAKKNVPEGARKRPANLGRNKIVRQRLVPRGRWSHRTAIRGGKSDTCAGKIRHGNLFQVEGTRHRLTRFAGRSVYSGHLDHRQSFPKSLRNCGKRWTSPIGRRRSKLPALKQLSTPTPNLAAHRFMITCMRTPG